MEETRLVLTRTEGAVLLNVSTSTFDSWVKRGVLPAPIPGTRRWSRAAIDRALSGQTEAPASANDNLSAFELWQRSNAR